jgi:ATP phosphoribosyltransferase
MLTIALPKGELLSKSVRLFQSVGLDFSAALDKSNRQLQIADPTGTAKILLVRNADVPVYVEYGQAQLGVLGYDLLREKKPKVAHLLDLGFGYCRLSVAVKANSGYGGARDLPMYGRVASKFVNCAREYFDTLDLPVEIVPLYGSVELGPITGMSEAIVDLVATGTTLRENGLVEKDLLFESTARLIGNPHSYRLNQENLHQWCDKLRQNLEALNSAAPK